MAKSHPCGELSMPSVGLGTWEARDDSEIVTALNAALEVGYRHIDTAYAYENERVVGKVLNDWIKSGKLKREDLFVTTKLPIRGINSDRVEKYIKMSLENLGLDYVDLYLIHFPIGLQEGDGINFEPYDHKGLWKSMEAQVDAGRAKTIGVSNFTINQIDSILKFARIKPACNQIELHIYLQQPELVKFCQEHGIVVVAYSPIANPGYNKFLKRIGHEQRTDLLNILTDPVITKIAKNHGKSNVQIALRYLIQLNIVVIPKSVSPARLTENFDLFTFSLDDSEMEKLRTLDVGEKARIVDWRIIPTIDQHPQYPFGKK